MDEPRVLIEENPDRVALSIAFELLTADGYVPRNTYLYLLLNHQDSDGDPGPENCDHRLVIGDTIDWSQGRDTVPTGRIVARYVDFDPAPDPAQDFLVRVHDLSASIDTTTQRKDCDF